MTGAVETVWSLDLDAELELADPEGYRRSARMAARIAALRETLRGRIAAWLGADPLLLDPRRPPPRLDGSWTGHAWCPTPRALAALGATGATVEPAPPLEVLQRANHRAFAAAIGPLLPGAAFVRDLDGLRKVLATGAPHGHLLERPFGFSGRGRKHLRGPPTPANLRWCEASMEGHGRGLLVEPFVDIEAEFALHGLLDRHGTARFGRPTTFRTADGRWCDSAPAGEELSRAEHDALAATARRVAAALHGIGYFGPFGIDAHRWRDPDGAARFHPLSEINARYTMGWFDGMTPR